MNRADVKLTAKEVANYLGCHIMTVYLYLKRGQLKAKKSRKTPGGKAQWEFSWLELEAQILNNTITKGQ